VNRLSGRIYKITHGTPERPEVSDAGQLPPAALLPLLEAKHEFSARHARLRLQELAVAGTDLTAVKADLLRTFAGHPDTVTKLRTLWALHAIKGTNADFLRAQLNHVDEYIRIWAIRLLLDDRAAAASDPATPAALIALAGQETAAPVRLALTSALQRVPISACAALATPLLRHPEDAADHNLPQMLWYGIEALGDHDPAALAALAKVAEVPLVRRCIARRLTESQNHATLLEPLLAYAAGASAAVQADVLEGMAAALQGQRKATPPKGWAAAATVFAVSQDPAVGGAFRTLGAIFADPAALLAMQKTVLDPQAGKPARREALRSLIEARADGLRPLCEQLLTEPALLATAAGGLALEADATLVDLILKHYPSAAPEDRAGLVSTLISRATWAARLLQGVTDGRVPLKDLTAFHARQIRNYQDPALTKMVTGIWGDVRESTAEKTARIAQWKTQLTKPVLDQADRAKGRLLYQSLCATCHVLNGEGGRIGPELTGSNRDNLDYLLQNIGDPGSVVAKDYQLTTLTMKDARVLAGFIRSKNDRTLTLQTPAEAITVPLSDIGQTEIAPISLMPEGLLESLNANDLRDLIGYLMAK
jgi:putative heme-binding domain-containing protein